MAFSRTEADAILKELYLGPVREQLNLSTPLLAEIGSTEENVEGRRSVFPTHVTRSESVGARADGGTLPTASSQGYVDAIVDHRYEYGTIKVTGPAIRSTKSDRGSFIRAVDSEMKGVLAELKEDFNRQIAGNLGDGALTVGVLGYVADAEAIGQTVLTIESSPGVAATAGTMRRFRVGMEVDIVQAASTAPSITDSNFTISAVDTTNKTITVPALTVAADADTAVVRSGAGGTKEINGLRGIVNSSGTLHNINPSTYAVWKATVNSNSDIPRALSEDLMQQVTDDVSIASGEEGNLWVSEHTQRRKYAALLTSMKRAVNTLDLKGGFKALAFNDNVPFIVDRFVDSDRSYLVNKGHLGFAQLSDWDWADDDGSILSRTSGEDAFEAYLYKFGNLYTDKRNSHGVITDLST